MVDPRLGDVPATVSPTDARVNAACQAPCDSSTDERMVSVPHIESSITSSPLESQHENAASVPNTLQSVITSSPARPCSPSWTGAASSVRSQVLGQINAISDSSSSGAGAHTPADPATNNKITRITESNGPAEELVADLAMEEKRDDYDYNNRNKTVNCDDSNMKTIQLLNWPASATLLKTVVHALSPHSAASAKHSDNATTTNNNTTTDVPHGDSNQRDLNSSLSPHARDVGKAEGGNNSQRASFTTCHVVPGKDESLSIKQMDAIIICEESHANVALASSANNTHSPVTLLSAAQTPSSYCELNNRFFDDDSRSDESIKSASNSNIDCEITSIGIASATSKYCDNARHETKISAFTNETRSTLVAASPVISSVTTSKSAFLQPEFSQLKSDVDASSCTVGNGQTNAKISLSAGGVLTPSHYRRSVSTCSKSFAYPARVRTGWKLPLGGGLRGGAPGETSAIANGTSNWGPPPPQNATASTGVGGWGNAPPTSQGGASAWASAVSTASTTTEDVSNGQKLLNSATKVSSPSTTMGTSSAPATSSTSWAAAAGKGILPTEQSSGQMNGATNKQLEQLNSVREALFSQDGWGVGTINQETSWDVGGSVSDSPATATAKTDNMQWQAPSGRNDGTDLWKSTLSGIPQVTKPQPATPWHNPRNPTDFKNWGDPDDEPGAVAGAVGGAGMDEPPRGNHSWDDGVSGAGQPWDSDRGPSKNKEDSWNSGPGNNHWGGAGGPPGPSRPGPDMGANWGSHPPPVKPSNWAGGPGAAQGMMGGTPGHWPTESPTTNRRFDDGTSIWGGKPGQVSNGPTGASVGWKDMPTPNMGGSRPGGPPGPPSRPPPGAGMKPNEMSPWGQPHPNGRAAMGLGGGWGGADDNSPWMDDKNGGGGVIGNSGNVGGWGSSGAGDSWGAPRGKSRGSPSWEDPTSSNSGGPVPMPGGGWNNNRMMPLPKEGIWASKQFRILADMGYRKEDVEMALRTSNMQMDEAHEMLKSSMSRGGLGMPPVSDIGSGFVRSAAYDDVGIRFPPSGMPSYPPAELPPSSLQSSGGGRGGGPNSGVNPALVQQMPMGGGNPGHPGGAPPRPSNAGSNNGGPPSTSHLRVLVTQIQMAVQAGHLNAQILNQPLAPQTLLLLNQLLQQIKGLQQCQHQYSVAQATGARSSMNQFSVQITKHKQQITNLQNQITAQQAQYLKNQHQTMGGGGGGAGALGQAAGFPGGPSGVGQDNDLTLGLTNLTMSGSDHGHGQQGGNGGSKLNKWIKSDVGALNTDMPDFSRAPGSTSNNTTSSSKPNNNSQSSPNLLLADANGPWSNGTNGSIGSGWPDTASGNGSLMGNGNNNMGGGNDNKGGSANDDNDFGIPEFVPGKAWKGPGLKDPAEDPTLTPGSVASTPLVLQQGGTNSTKDGSGKPQTVSSSGMENNSMIPTSTWSFGNNMMKDPSAIMLGGLKDWGSSSQTLTAMGHDLWGQSRSNSSSKLMPSSSGAGGGSSWPSVSNGWSNGTNMPVGTATASCWLLLKNLTAQIDGSTLRTLCMQHGPLNNFHLYLTQGLALVKYSNPTEAKKAQNALHNCVLGNTTIFAVVAGEHEVEEIARNLAQSGNSNQNRGGGGGGGGLQQHGYVQLNRSGSTDTCWSSSGLSNNASPWPTSGLGPVASGSVWGNDDQHNRTTPLDFLPPDLLSETM